MDATRQLNITVIPAGNVIITRDALMELLEQFHELAKFVHEHADSEFISKFTAVHGFFGEGHFCCHGGDPSFPTDKICKDHTSYSSAAAKVWCIANMEEYSYMSKGSCSSNQDCNSFEESKQPIAKSE